MDKKKYLIAGLGNPAPEFEKTPHNVGFITIDRLAREQEANWKKTKGVSGLTAKFNYRDSEVILLKPLTYMNKSGFSVKSALRFWKINTRNLLIIQDDSDIELGRLKIVFDQSSGGHKGLDSIIQAIGNQKFSRLKIGVRPKVLKSGAAKHIKAEKFILRTFPLEWQILITKSGEEAACYWLENGLDKAMSKYNRRDG